MQVKCKKCGKEYNIKDDFIKKADLKMRCRGCGEVIVIKKLASGKAAAPIAQVPPATPRPPAKAEPKVGEEISLPAVKSGGDGMEEFDLESAPVSILPKSRKETLPVAGIPLPPDRLTLPAAVDDPFDDLTAIKPSEKGEFEFDEAPRASKGGDLPAPRQKSDEMEFALDIPSAKGPAAESLPAVRVKSPEDEFGLDAVPSNETPRLGDLPAPKADTAKDEFNLDEPAARRDPAQGDFPVARGKPVEGEFSLDVPPMEGEGGVGDLPVPSKKRVKQGEFGMDLPAAKTSQTDEPFGVDIGEAPDGPEQPPAGEEGDIPAVLSPSSILPGLKEREKAADEPFGGLDLPQKKPASGVSAGGESANETGDIFASLDMPPSAVNFPQAITPQPAKDGKLDMQAAKEKLDVERSQKFVGKVGGTAFGEIDLGEAPEKAGASSLEETLGEKVGLPDRKYKGGETVESLAEEAMVELDSAAEQELVAKRDAARAEKEKKKEAPRGWKVVRGGKNLVLILILLILVGAGVVIWQTGTYMSIYKSFSKYVMGEDIDAYYARRDKAVASVSSNLTNDDYKDYKEGIEKLKRIYDGNRKDAFLAAYVSTLISVMQLRFGRDSEVDKVSEGLLHQVPSDNEFQLTYAMAVSSQKLVRRVEGAQQVIGALLGEHQKNPRDKELLHLAALGSFYIGDGQQALSLYTKLAGLENNSRRSSFGVIRALFLSGDTEKGDEQLNKFIEENPEFIEAQVVKARKNVKEGSVQQAESIIGKIQKEGKFDSYLEIPIRAIVGMIHLKKDEYQKAKEVFDEILKTDPMNVDALVGSGKIDLYEEKPANALGRFNIVLHLDPLNDEANFGTIQSQILLSKYKDAKAVLIKIEEKYKDDHRFYYFSALLAMALGDDNEAENHFKTAIEKNPIDLENYLALAEMYFKQGRNTDAIEVLGSARNKLPLTARLLTAFAKGRINRGEYEKAHEELAEAVKKDPEYSHALYYMGVTLFHLGNNEAALEHFEKVAARNPAYPGLVLHKGLIFEKMGDTEKALKSYNEAMKQKPDDEGVLIRAVAIYTENEKYDESKVLVDKILKINPASSEGMYYLGRIFLGKNQFAEALHSFEKAIKLNPNVGLYYQWAGLASEGLGNFTDALKYSEKALEKDENLAGAYLLRGKLRAKMGMIKDGKADLNRAMELKPGLVEAWGPLGIVYEEMRNFKEAIKAYETYLEHRPGDFEIHSRLGLIFYDRGNVSGARKHFTQAAQVSKEMSPYSKWRFTSLFYLGMIAEKDGNTSKAVEYFQEYIHSAPNDAIDREEVLARLEKLTSP